MDTPIQTPKGPNETPKPGATPNEDGDKKTPNGNATLSNDIIAGNYVLLNQIGKGAFGEIFLSFNPVLPKATINLGCA